MRILVRLLCLILLTFARYVKLSARATEPMLFKVCWSLCYANVLWSYLMWALFCHRLHINWTSCGFMLTSFEHHLYISLTNFAEHFGIIWLWFRDDLIISWRSFEQSANVLSGSDGKDGGRQRVRMSRGGCQGAPQGANGGCSTMLRMYMNAREGEVQAQP